MNCQTAREQLGAYADGELPPELAAEIEEHARGCEACADELRALREMMEPFAAAAAMKAPPELWPLIEQRLDAALPVHAARRPAFRRRPVMIAASLAMVIGGGLVAGLWLRSGANMARAEDLNFDLLLDGLADDVDGAFARFLEFHQAEPIAPQTAFATSLGLRFALPSKLPGDFRLEQAYRFRLGTQVGIAASYRRGSEPLLVFFHRPANGAHHGIRTEISCLIDGQEVHAVEVGPWRLAHFTDPTTCHCVLSTLNVEKELPAVFAVIAPDFKAGPRMRGH